MGVYRFIVDWNILVALLTQMALPKDHNDPREFEKQSLVYPTHAYISGDIQEMNQSLKK